METFEQQEQRAREHMSAMAVVKAALIAGLFTFLVPGGGPWMSYDTSIAVMGRVLTDSPILAGLWQAAFALAYGWVIAAVIYSMSLMGGIAVGALMSVPLYVVNSFIMKAGFGMESNEVHVGISHFMFCLIFSCVYRAVAVPAPRELQHHGRA